LDPEVLKLLKNEGLTFHLPADCGDCSPFLVEKDILVQRDIVANALTAGNYATARLALATSSTT